MEIVETTLKDSFVIINEKFEDERGVFIEFFNNKRIEKIIGNQNFVQDNYSKSKKGVLRGLHYQIKKPQGKLVRCLSGCVLDVIVDLRKSSPTFGKYEKIFLNSNEKSIWVPVGFAHGFYVLSNEAEVAYKITDYYYPDYDRTLMWNDPVLNIDWNIICDPIISLKDNLGKSFDECEKYD